MLCCSLNITTEAQLNTWLQTVSRLLGATMRELQRLIWIFTGLVPEYDCSAKNSDSQELPR